MAESQQSGACGVESSWVNQDGKNSVKVRCQRCGSLILSPNNASLADKEIFLPFMKKKTELQKPSDGETLKSHWLVDDMYTFENVGFSNTVNGIKYLICADCEIGPVGWHSTDAKNEFYIALDRVLQEQ